MAEQPTNSTAAVVLAVRKLAALCRDSESGYRRAYEETRDRRLRVEFGQCVDEREDMGEALNRCLAELGEQAGQGGTGAGAAHRLFLDLRAVLGSRDRDAVLREIVRGESVLEAAFDATLAMAIPIGVRGVLRHQHRLVRRSRDRFQAMIAGEPRTPIAAALACAVATIRRDPVASVRVGTIAVGLLVALALGHRRCSR